MLICAEDVIVRDDEDELPEIADKNEAVACPQDNGGDKVNSESDDEESDNDCILVETSGLEVINLEK